MVYCLARLLGQWRVLMADVDREQVAEVVALP